MRGTGNSEPLLSAGTNFLPNQESERGQRQILCRPASGGLQRINNAAGLPYIAQEFQEENSQPDLRPVRQDEDAAKFGKGGIFAEVSSSAAPMTGLTSALVLVCRELLTWWRNSTMGGSNFTDASTSRPREGFLDLAMPGLAHAMGATSPVDISHHRCCCSCWLLRPVVRFLSFLNIGQTQIMSTHGGSQELNNRIMRCQHATLSTFRQVATMLPNVQMGKKPTNLTQVFALLRDAVAASVHLPRSPVYVHRGGWHAAILCLYHLRFSSLANKRALDDLSCLWLAE
ncbi:hypothetical protein KC358_g2 [Hortaea werneckii]|nr:hypothetical protein KC358_g2 [Hortaea werneckii]